MGKRKKKTGAGGRKRKEDTPAPAAEPELEIESQEEAEPDADTDASGDMSLDNEPDKKPRRRRPPKGEEWVNDIKQSFIKDRGEEIAKEFRSKTPDVQKVTECIKELNLKIQTANQTHGASPDHGIIQPPDRYALDYNTWMQRAPQIVEGLDGWKMYYQLQNALHQFNTMYKLPETWNFPPEIARRVFGDKPDTLEEQNDPDTDSAVSYSEESESEDSESEAELEGIDALESRMRREYSALSQGKVLYWWPVGTGTQIFVRYGSKGAPIYRVRAGSSEPYNERRTEQVLSKTRGNAKTTITNSYNMREEVWKYTRKDVQDIIGVGWKVDGDDDATTNALSLIRPKQEVYPHTRVLVRWRGGQISLERRGFVRRIATGSSLNGDRMIYLKAKEMEEAYRGHAIESDDNQESSRDTDESDTDASYQSRRRTRVSRPRKTRRKERRHVRTESGSDTDSENSQSTVDSEQDRISKRYRRGKKTKPSKGTKDSKDEIRTLKEEIKRLKIKNHTQSKRRRRRRND
ncbi:hypothetical protein BDV26DRAFT_149428 [Aspergillus bertholletiae]|uniref:Uncharacterized protein n=1 Tax=Aspergillus bertholletiae TaxID=1226010 RepID=A0A5N7AMY9_9EURO|nr:hypothetical protein BDV26DRAFT_149428 [Aspergillus bertholletiae]